MNTTSTPIAEMNMDGKIRNKVAWLYGTDRLSFQQN